MDYGGAVEVANHLLERFGVEKKIKDIKECNGEFFVALYEALTGELPEGIKQNATKKEEKVRNCQLVIDALSKEVLETDLSHIEAVDVINGNIASIGNLLEIYMRLLEYILEELEKDEQSIDDPEEQSDGDDSNLLSSDHDILSDVIQQEFKDAVQDKGIRSRKGSTKIMEKYLMPTEAPTHETDDEMGSIHDFTQDSLDQQCLGRERPPKAKVRHKEKDDPHANGTFEIRPFAYVSSSTHDSTEELAREAEDYRQRNAREMDARSASTSNLNRKTDGKIPSDNFRNTDPDLLTSFSKKKHPLPNSLKSSMSSASWPSILSTNELNDKDMDTPYKEVGVRPRGPFPFEAEGTDNERPVSVNHQHTHHHYYHQDTRGNSHAKPKDKRDEHVSTKGTQQRGSIDGSKTALEQRASSRATQISSSAVSQMKDAERLSVSRVNAVSRSNAAEKEHAESILKSNEQPSKMRSVHTSVSDMPFVAEDDGRTKKQTNIRAASADERSSVSELNELLNSKHEAERTGRPKPETLSELDKRLEEVRAAVRKLEQGRLLSSDPTTEDLRSIKKYLRIDEKRFPSHLAGDILSEEANDSICSDSEFDYGNVHQHCARDEHDSEVLPERGAISRRYQKMSSKHFDKEFHQDDLHGSLTPENRPRKKKVQFRDRLVESRDERLERLIKALKEEDLENEDMIASVRKRYSRNLVEAQKGQKDKLKTKEDKYSTKTGNAMAPQSANNCASRLARIYGQRARKPVRDLSKQRKRSASCSPVPKNRRKGRLVLEEEDILPLMEEEFPHLYLSPVTARLMWQKQMRQISNLTKAAHLRKPTVIQRHIEDSKRKQDALMGIMKKELEHNRRLKDAKEKAREQRQVKNKLRERRLASARARRYYDDYQVRMRARMLKRRTKEEKIFKQLFEDALDIQKQRVRELRSYAKEQRAVDTQRKQNELESIENFYRDQFTMMAEAVARERYDIQVREKAQAKVVESMRKGIRQRMESDIKCLQEELVRDDDPAYFRHLDAENLRKELQLATYKMRM